METELRNALLRRIDAYAGSVHDLGDLVADLDAVWGSEIWTEDSRRREFRRAWGRMEEVYATAVESHPPQLTDLDAQRVQEQLTRLRELLPQ